MELPSNNNTQSGGENHMFQLDNVIVEAEPFDPNGPESFFSHVNELESNRYSEGPRTVSHATESDSTDPTELEVFDVDPHDLIPTTLATSTKINDQKGKYWLQSLLDHVGSHVRIR